MDLANAILAYAMAGAFVLWLIGEDREGSSWVLDLVSAAIVALLLVGEDREYQWWISGFVLVVLGALGSPWPWPCSGRSSPACHLRVRPHRCGRSCPYPPVCLEEGLSAIRLSVGRVCARRYSNVRA